MIVVLPVSHLVDADCARHVPGVQVVEFKDARHTFATPCRSLFHTHHGIVQDEFLHWLSSSKQRLTELDVRLLSFDCGPACRRTRVEEYYYMPQSSVLPRAAVLDLIRERLETVRRSVPVNVGVENLNYFPTDAYAHVCEANFITQVVSDNNVGLVLDLAHAIVTARNTGIDELTYVRALPLEHVCEVHLSAPRKQDGIWRDAHASPTKREYALLDAILPYVPRGTYVAVEHFSSWKGVVDDYRVLVEFLEERGVLDDVPCDPVAV